MDVIVIVENTTINHMEEIQFLRENFSENDNSVDEYKKSLTEYLQEVIICPTCPQLNIGCRVSGKLLSRRRGQIWGVIKPYNKSPRSH